MVHFLKSIPLVALLLLAACETMPERPTVAALQGDARNPVEFRADDADCRKYAFSQAGAGDERHSTVAGSGTGSLIDGADSAQYAGFGLQRTYNRAYVRCLYLRGNKVPLLARERWPAPRSTWPPDKDAYFLPLQR